MAVKTFELDHTERDLRRIHINVECHIFYFKSGSQVSIYNKMNKLGDCKKCLCLFIKKG